MPQFPTYGGAREGLARDQGARPAPVDNFGEDLARLGTDVDELGAHIEKRRVEKARFNAEIGLDKALADQDLDDQKVSEKWAADGTGWAEDSKRRFQSRIGQYLQTVDPTIRDEFAARVGVLDSKYRAKSNEYEVTRRKNWSLSQIDGASQGWANDAYATGDPAGGLQRLEDYLKASGFDAATQAETRAKLAPEILKAAAFGLADRGDFDGAEVAVSGSYEDKLIGQESNGDPNAKASTSSATGHAQFLKDTWKRVVNSREGQAAGLSIDGRTDPEQARKGLRIFTAWNRNDLVKAGYEPTEKNLYLAHFLGSAGAIGFLNAMSKDPSKLATDVVDSDSVNANKAVFYGRDANGKRTVARSLAEVYKIQTRRFAGTAPASTGASGGEGVSGSLAAVLPRLGWQDQRQVMNVIEAKRSENTVGRQIAKVEAQLQIEDDIASIRATGKPLPDLTPELIAERVGADDAVKFIARRDQAYAYYSATTGLDALPNDQVISRIAGLREDMPDPGAVGYAAAAETLKDAEAKADKIISDRQEDPAAAVSANEGVKAAASAVDRARPETVQALIAARIEAQRAFTIPGAERPLTKVELTDLVGPLRNLPPDDVEFYNTVDAITAMIRNTYGEHAPAVLRQIATRGGLGMDAAQTFADEIYRGAPTARGGRKLDLAADVSRSEKATSLAGVAESVARRVGSPFPQPNFKQINFLKGNSADPEIVKDFDAKFGEGAAAKVLAGKPLK